MYNDAEMEQLADTHNFIFAVPQGLGFLAGWNIGLSFGGNADDVNFISRLIDQLMIDYNINNKKIYAAGFSNGGFFSYRLACELSDKIAAIASVAGSMNPNWIRQNNPSCNPTHQMPILQITGTTDNVIPITGGNGGLPLSNVFEYWTEFNNTRQSPQITNINSNTERNVYSNGTNGAVVEFIRIKGRGHEWPKIKNAGLRENASIRIWDFFSKYDIDGEINTLSTEKFETEQISIYPNPASDYLYITNLALTDSTTYTISSITGQLLISGKLASTTQEIDLTALESNLYILKIEDKAYKIFKTN